MSGLDKARTIFTIRNGLYHITVEFLDGVLLAETRA